MIILCVVMIDDVMLSVNTINDVMLNAITLNDVMLIVILLNDDMPSVVAPTSLNQRFFYSINLSFYFSFAFFPHPSDQRF